ncbi:MAG: FtsX-like permease family protein [Chloroflexota bacterium]
MSVLWHKTGRDLFQNRSRFFTIVFTIGLGVFALGMVVNLYVLLHTEMAAGLQRVNPSHIHLAVPGGIGEVDLQRVLRIQGVTNAEALSMAPIHWKKAGDPDWTTAILIARPDYQEQPMDYIDLDSGAWPERYTAAVERLTGAYFDLALGESILIRLGQNDAKTLTLNGIAHSVQSTTPRLGGEATFYVTPATLEKLTGVARPNWLNVQIADFSAERAEQIARQAREQVDAPTPAEVTDPAEGQYQGQVQALSVILAVLGSGILGLSTLLIVNVFHAMMTQQVRQIGSMKTIGAATFQIVGIYLNIALCYGLIAVTLGIPLATLAAHKLAGVLLAFMNLEAPGLQIIPAAWIVQGIAGIGVPVLAALLPVFDGARISVRQAIQDYGVSATFGRSWYERALVRVQGFSMSWAISLRNLLRRKQRSLLTLVMLLIGGLLFISVMSVKGSFESTLREMVSVFRYDVVINFSSPQKADDVQELAAEIASVAYTEMHWTTEGVFDLGEGNERSLVLRALPANTQIYVPKVVSGRWLLPGDGNSLVLNAKIAEEEQIRVGDYISLTSTAKPTRWLVVGLAVDLTNRQRTVFVPLDAFAKANKQKGYATDLLVQAGDHTDSIQEQVEKDLSNLFEEKNLFVGSTELANRNITQNLSQFDLITYLLMAMAILAASVGGLGLMGAMSLNVSERMREIGVMRAIGGDSRRIAGIFINEGIALGFLSWLLAAALSPPGSRAFAKAIGSALFGIPLNESLSWTGIGAWLVIVLSLSTLASAWPAVQAARVSVRDSLLYE